MVGLEIGRPPRPHDQHIDEWVEIPKAIWIGRRPYEIGELPRITAWVRLVPAST